MPLASRGAPAKLVVHAYRVALPAGRTVALSSPALRPAPAAALRTSSSSAVPRRERAAGQAFQRGFHATPTAWQGTNRGMAAWHPGVIIVPQQTAYVRTRPTPCSGSHAWMRWPVLAPVPSAPGHAGGRNHTSCCTTVSVHLAWFHTQHRRRSWSASASSTVCWSLA